MQTVDLTPALKDELTQEHGLAAHYLAGMEPGSIQAQLYRAAYGARPDSVAIDQVLDAYRRAHAEPEQRERPRDPCDPGDPVGSPLPHPYFLEHRRWNAPGKRPATCARRGRVLLLAAQGRSLENIAALEGVTLATVRRDARALGIACPRRGTVS